MNKYSFLVIAAALSLSAKGYCVEVTFDQGVDVSGIIQQIDTDKPFNGPQPGHPQPSHDMPGNHGGDNHPGDNHGGDNHGGFPGNHGGDNNHPGDNHGGDNHGGFPGDHGGDNHPGDNHGGDNHGGFPGDHGGFPGDHGGFPGDHGGFPGDHHGDNNWDNNHHQQPYSPVYQGMNCTTWEFTSQTPNSRTEDVTEAEQSGDCYTDANGTRYCRPTGNYLSRKVTVNIGARQLQSWEKESLQVCLEYGNVARLDLSGMLFDYSVTQQDKEGFLGFGRSTTFNLTPGAKKPATPDGKEISVNNTSIGEGGALFMTLSDARADYYKGEQIDISLDGMRMPGDLTGLTPAQLIDALTQVKVSGSFPVSPMYTIKLMDVPKPGTYVVTINFTRRGQLSSGQTVSTMETIEVK